MKKIIFTLLYFLNVYGDQAVIKHEVTTMEKDL